ncbi:GNAT family N-acetyltransferase [Limimaricola pyoseonensis]|uniref:Putative acetyltransferase n=1 Tax=Limimaricola pyoseonensis TaxID=521013 RepID=A0A1G7KT54_9RHOB|nr:N-acetyltransferase [Limimaricola pyoseonensis]SDF40264.1 putative acetyltransferase [Limimaricola pyoseonensis]
MTALPPGPGEGGGPSAAAIRAERPGDAAAIGEVTRAAFSEVPYASGTEAAIVAALREAGALTLSLVAEEAGRVVGHVAVSPVEGIGPGWFGLGPVSVRPGRQKAGIGARLVRAALERLRAAGASGCVVLGDPGYYGRFGFAARPGVGFEGAPPEYFQQIRFAGPAPEGRVRYHPAFGG